MKNATEWFVEPIGTPANKLVGQHLGQRAEESELHQQMVKSMGERRRADLYCVTWADVKALEKSRAGNSELTFNIFNRKTSGGQIIEVTALVKSWRGKKSARASAGSK